MSLHEQQEREASEFAAELLMPEKMLRESVKKLSGPLTDVQVEALADEYQVPVVHVFARLLKLKLIKRKP